jgi:hypothetical protein
MKRIFALTVGLVMLIVVLGETVSAADIPKQGAFSLKVYVTGTWKAITMGEERLHATYDGVGIVANDKGTGFLNNAASYNLGQVHGVNGIKESETGFIVYTDADGDKVHATYDWKGVLFKSSHGTFTFVGGTGKYAGITGGGASTFGPTPKAKNDVHLYQGITKANGQYRLP